MTTYASFPYYPNHPSYLTAGKRYPVKCGMLGKGFYFTDDEGNDLYSSWTASELLDGRDWVRYEDDEPKLWKHMTPEEKGALLLAHHEGREIQYYRGVLETWEKCPLDPCWDKQVAYRVKPKPEIKTVDIWIKCSDNSGYQSIGLIDLVDNCPDFSSVRKLGKPGKDTDHE